MADKDEENNSASEDIPKASPLVPETSNLDETQETASAETNSSGNGNPQVATKDKAKSNSLFF